MTTKSLNILFLLSLFFSTACSHLKKTAAPVSEIKTKDLSQPLTSPLLANLLASHPQYFDTLLHKNNVWNIQIIYTQIDRTEDNTPRFTHYYYNLQPNLYYYPASTVKLPTAALALQKLNELKIEGLDKYATIITDSGAPAQTMVYNDPTAPDGRPTIAQYIKKIFLVSDNDAFNRLYEFLGQAYINNHLHAMGYDSVQVLHRLSIALTEAQNRTTNPIKFYDTAARLLYQQPVVKSTMDYQKRWNFLGTGHFSGGYYTGNVFENTPFDFSMKNRLALPDLHSILQSILFPQSVSKKQRFNLTDEDYRFLYHYMCMYPQQSDYPQYDTAYNDAYAKLLMYGGKGKVDPGIFIFNKEGDAYGFLTDAAYIIDKNNGVEFMLSATISCNSDGIYNDDKYDYENVGYPFLKNLGQVIYQYELKRERRHKPDFSNFFK